MVTPSGSHKVSLSVPIVSAGLAVSETLSSLEKMMLQERLKTILSIGLSLGIFISA